MYSLKSAPLSTKLLLLVLLPLSGLAWFGCRSSLAKWRVYQDYRTLERNSAVLQQIGRTVHELQKERGRSAGFLGSNGRQFSAELDTQSTATDAAVAHLDDLLRDFAPARFGPRFAAVLATGRGELGQLGQRRAAIRGLRVAAAESTAGYTGTIARLLDVVVAMSHLSNDAEIGNGISCYVNFVQAKEQAGLEWATLTGVFAADAFTPEAFRRFSQVQAAQETFLQVFASFASEEQRDFAAAQVSGPAVEAVAAMRQTAFARATAGAFGVAAAAWFDASTARLELMKAVEDRLAADYARRADEIMAAAHREFVGLGLTTAAILGFTLAAAWGLKRRITRDLLELAARLADGSEELTGAAHQVSAASQSTAAGASEQASSLEETAASLEEIAGMTQGNSAAAADARRLAGETHAAANTGAAEMDEMKAAMNAIRASADNIAAILQTIDQIAFQTKILALNAAVEAARAGEHGAGFAVVAEEVRALAQRCAVAAKETEEKIAESVHNSAHGVEISGRVARHFAVIVEKVGRVDTLVAGIASSSQDQSQGIGQLNTAVAQMDRVTQSNAAAAEETAAQAEQLNAQATELTGVIGRLLQMVEGRRRNDSRGRPGLHVPGGRRRGDKAAVARPPSAALA